MQWKVENNTMKLDYILEISSHFVEQLMFIVSAKFG